MINLKEILDKNQKKYETYDFISTDPILFPHRFSKKEDIEIAGFIAASFAYGKRSLFIAKLNELFDIMNNEPYRFIKSYKYTKHSLNGLNYRFAKEDDIHNLLYVLSTLYNDENSSLNDLFYEFYNDNKNINPKLCKIHNMFLKVANYFYNNCLNQPGAGFKHLIPDASNMGSCKRLNMFLRWMVRKSDVDLGVWKFIDKSELLIPLDVHVGNISRSYNLLKRKNNDYKSVIELTENLKKYDPYDPVKYDFALFSLGVFDNSLI